MAETLLLSLILAFVAALAIRETMQFYFWLRVLRRVQHYHRARLRLDK